MDDRRFDAWTRRRFGVVTSGFIAALAGLGTVEKGAAKKHKHCKKSETKCGKKCVKGECCPGKSCGKPGQNCTCGKTIDGKAFCFQEIVALCEQCDSNAECMDPFRCVKIPGCDAVTAICLPACGAKP